MDGSPALPLFAGLLGGLFLGSYWYARNLALLGTNFGGERTPGWVHNLLANPDAVAAWRDNRADVTAVELEPEQQEPIWETAIAAYPNYADYRQKAAHRTIRVFELTAD